MELLMDAHFWVCRRPQVRLEGAGRRGRQGPRPTGRGRRPAGRGAGPARADQGPEGAEREAGRRSPGQRQGRGRAAAHRRPGQARRADRAPRPAGRAPHRHGRGPGRRRGEGGRRRPRHPDGRGRAEDPPRRSQVRSADRSGHRPAVEQAAVVVPPRRRITTWNEAQALFISDGLFLNRDMGLSLRDQVDPVGGHHVRIRYSKR